MAAGAECPGFRRGLRAARYQNAVANHCSNQFQLNLTPGQIADLVEFLKSL